MTGLPPDSWAVDPSAVSARELVPGLWRLRLPMPWHHVSHVNAYAVARADGGIVLIDCGSGGHRSALAALENALAQAGFSLADVRDLVITHFHTDHMGLIGPIKAASGCAPGASTRWRAYWAPRLSTPRGSPPRSLGSRS
jgi:glyoxylase-like metal-dependent hydrolase (beta-lactamase superfamily II)